MIAKVVYLYALLHIVSGLWECTSDVDCSSRQGSVCVDGSCECPAGQEAVNGGTICVGVAPYYSSPCVTDKQCSGLFSNFECRQVTNSSSICACTAGHHYFLGRCWPTKDFGQSCNRDEECLTVPRDPYGLKCDNVCVCADGYTERQRGECRKIGKAVGDGCVLDSDCDFDNGICDITNFVCTTATASQTINLAKELSEDVIPFISDREVQGVHNIRCTNSSECGDSQQCVSGVCICPRGFYLFNDRCYAELGTPSTVEQCDGLLSIVEDGVCKCRPNFFYEENMRDCVKATRRITDSCVTDSNCHTFGAASRCGAPTGPWGLRTCECVTEDAVWDAERNMCRLFAGVGEECQVDSDCMAGEIEINCVVEDSGVGFCRCPPHLVEMDGLCLSIGLELGDSCQSRYECTATNNTDCIDGICACANGFQLDGNYCAPVIGGPCALDSDCIINNTICSNSTTGLTCQCQDEFVAHEQQCFEVSTGYNGTCSITAQCKASMGDAGECVSGLCVCTRGYHFRDGSCWPVTGLFEVCSRSSQCYLGDLTDKVVCRNGFCQCDFDFPFSEELQTCVSSAMSLKGSLLIVFLSVIYMLNQL